MLKEMVRCMSDHCINHFAIAQGKYIVSYAWTKSSLQTCLELPCVARILRHTFNLIIEEFILLYFVTDSHGNIQMLILWMLAYPSFSVCRCELLVSRLCTKCRYSVGGILLLFRAFAYIDAVWY